MRLCGLFFGGGLNRKILAEFTMKFCKVFINQNFAKLRAPLRLIFIAWKFNRNLLMKPPDKFLNLRHTPLVDQVAVVRFAAGDLVIDRG